MPSRHNEILTSLHGRRFGIGHRGELLLNGRPIIGPTDELLYEGAPLAFDPAYAYEFFDDFLTPASTTASDYTAYTSTDDAGTGTNAFQDVVGGVYNVVTAAADNDYHAMSSVAENWKFAEGKPLWAEMRFKLSEANTNESTWWFGLTDTLTTGGMQANAAGPLASYDGALIYKTPETAMTVNFETSNAATQNTLSAFATGVTDTWHRCGFYFDGAPTTSYLYPWFYNGTDWTMGTRQPITLAGLEEMHLVFGVKAGPTGGAETLQVDYVRCLQLR